MTLDRGLREALGICDGETAVVHPWRGPNRSRRLHRLRFSTRSVYAHPSIPVRADLEKPVCRLSADAMSAIDESEAERRATWSSADADEGYVDCAEFHGIFPPFPAIYVDYFDMSRLFGQSAGPLVCPVVQIRPKLSTRIADDAGEFAWVGVIGLVAVLAQATDLGLLPLALLATAVVAFLVLLRVRRSVR